MNITLSEIEKVVNWREKEIIEYKGENWFEKYTGKKNKFLLELVIAYSELTKHYIYDQDFYSNNRYKIIKYEDCLILWEMGFLYLIANNKNKDASDYLYKSMNLTYSSSSNIEDLTIDGISDALRNEEFDEVYFFDILSILDIPFKNILYYMLAHFQLSIFLESQDNTIQKWGKKPSALHLIEIVENIPSEICIDENIDNYLYNEIEKKYLKVFL